jgi:spindle and kinetochore-associated protein 1
LLDGEELIRVREHVTLLEADLGERERGAEWEKQDLLEAKAMLTKLLQQSTPKAVPSKGQALSMNQEIRLLEEVEFQKIPSYLKGRLPLTRINETIVSLNRILGEKYSLLMKYDARAQLSTNDRQRCMEWKQLEGDDLELSSKVFVTENEVKGVIKLDPSTRTILSILRHTGRLKESRSVGVVRFLVQ